MAADLAIVGARVRTLDPERPFARAVAVRGGTIVAVGDEVRAACDARTEVIDARGAALIPGLVDSHIHPFWGAEVTRGVDLRGCASPAEALERLAAAEPQRGWLFAWGLDYDVAPTPVEIGEACRGAAVFVQLADLHTALASPRALQLAHVTGDHESVVVDDDGAPTGVLRETAGDLVLRAAPKLRWPQLRARHAEILRELNALGLTGGHMMDGDLSTLEMLRELEGAGDLTMRLRVPFWITPEVTDEQIEHLLTLKDVRGRLWRGGVVKCFADGVIDAGTAWLEAPDTHGESHAPLWPDPERMAAVMARFAVAGFQLATHTIGDAAVRFTLGAYIRAGAAPGVRHRLEHLEAIPDDLVRSIPRAGVVASMQPVHVSSVRADGTGVWNERLGPERAARAFRMRDLLDAGALLTLGSDWPVADADPRRGLAAAQLRDVVPAQRITATEALAGYTTAPALVAGDEWTGRIREGMRADLTGLARDPIDTPAAELPDTPVWLTVVGGRVVHRDDRL
ncbi:amidohydrolase [Solirubrobacter phytolaccae]|uniref:Amidohydrolase n=1 Tax=Solirubrobacter phytolaccae TaxID=1404360 RepID=A0A9X3N6E0_9ACTN|nr:amidohydrolase [Solirubrobacter phytolaccae]MDA0179152.1 amidohydrolase [Solirubrobacter phytolaccae]